MLDITLVKDIRKVSKMSKRLNGINGNIKIYINTDTGRVFADEHKYFNDYKVYDDNIKFLECIKYPINERDLLERILFLIDVLGIEVEKYEEI